MAGDLALDTNAVAALIADDRSLWAIIDDAGLLVLPVVVYGELFLGALASARVEENFAQLERFSQLVDIYPCDSATALHYGLSKDRLRRKGRPIPENDLWIAAVCIQHGLTLVTRDAHFAHVEGLATVAW